MTDQPMTVHDDDAELRASLIDWLNAFKADPFSTGADKVDRLLEVIASRLSPTIPDHQQPAKGRCGRCGERVRNCSCAPLEPLVRLSPTIAEGVLREALLAVKDAMLNGGDGVEGDFGWSITKLNKARPLIRAALEGNT